MKYKYAGQIADSTVIIAFDDHDIRLGDEVGRGPDGRTMLCRYLTPEEDAALRRHPHHLAPHPSRFGITGRRPFMVIPGGLS